MSLALGILASAAVVLTAWRLTRAAAGLRRHEAILLFGGLGMTQVISSQLVAGTLLRLTPFWVAALNVGLALGVGLFVRPPQGDRSGVRQRFAPGLRRMVTALTAGRPLAWLLAALLVGQTALVMATAAVLPPQGWDEWWYHLPPIAHWTSTGRVDLLPVAAEWQDPAAVSGLDDYQRRYRLSVTGFWANVYPLNTETAAMWSLLFLHHDRWVDLAQGPLVLLGAVAVYGLARWARVPPPGPLLAGLLWALLPINQMQARTAYTDTALAALTLAALLFFLRWAETRRRVHFLAFGLFAGLALGTKPPAIAYVGALGLLTLWLAARPPEAAAQPPAARLTARPSWRVRLRVAAAHGLALALLCLATGGFWYLRTWAVYGNPVYPFTVQVLGRSLFPGLGSVANLIYVANTPPEYLGTGFLSNLIRSWFEAGEEPYSFYSRTGGFGAIWAVLGLPALAAYAWHAVRQQDRRALALLGLGALLLVLHSGGWWPRYSILIPGIGLVGAGWWLAASLSRPGLRWQAAALTTVAVLWSLLRADLSLAQALPRGLALPATQRTIGHLFLGDFAAIEQAVPAHAAIGYAPMTFIYPLYGPTLGRRVEQVDGRTAAEWLGAISQAHLDYVAMLKHYGPHYGWARQAQGQLTEIPTAGEVALFASRSE